MGYYVELLFICEVMSGSSLIGSKTTQDKPIQKNAEEYEIFWAEHPRTKISSR